ncbi:MAG: hypothetical protein AABX54_04720 [Nanoarchaeota archaeon]
MPDVALDRHDNPNHRIAGYDSYVPQSGNNPGELIELNLGYECGADGDLRIVQR